MEHLVYSAFPFIEARGRCKNFSKTLLMRRYSLVMHDSCLVLRHHDEHGRILCVLLQPAWPILQQDTSRPGAKPGEALKERPDGPTKETRC